MKIYTYDRNEQTNFDTQNSSYKIPSAALNPENIQIFYKQTPGVFILKLF